MPAFANEGFVSVAPAMTEIMYAIGADNKLLAVSDECDYPVFVKQKEKIGSGYLLNDDKIIKISPKYILALDSSHSQLRKFERFNIKILCFKYPDIDAIEKNILKLGELTGKTNEAKKCTELIEEKIKYANKGNKTKILYLVQTYPMITIGKNSFITDAIQKSGNISVTSNLNYSYPNVSIEYLIKQNPDVVMIQPFAEENTIKKFFPRAKIVRLKKEEIQYIHRPGTRVYKAVEFFSKF